MSKDFRGAKMPLGTEVGLGPGMGLVVYNVAWAKAYICTKWHFES